MRALSFLMCLYVLFFIFAYEFLGNEGLIGLRLWIIQSRINRDEGVSSLYHQHKCFGRVKMVQVTKMIKRKASMCKLFRVAGLFRVASSYLYFYMLT
ncbi:hypothetical protein Hanom_Chr06g00543731 [Helianthus anomalus]